MVFLHLSLAALGSSLVVIPVVLHLLMRQRPRYYVFPALRFVQARKTANRRRLKLRHMILLLLRCLAIAALALSLARPFIPSTQAANAALLGLLGVTALAAFTLALVTYTSERQWVLASGLAMLGLLLASLAVAWGWRIVAGNAEKLFGDQELPVAAALIFDVSPRMEYRHHNQTRLDVAKEFGQWLLRQLPTDSQVAIIRSSDARAVFSVDTPSATSAVEKLEVACEVRALPELIAPARELLETSPLARKEIYIFTDLTEMAWPTAEHPLDGLLNREPPVMVQLLDVGLEHTTNLELGDLRLSSDYLAIGDTLGLDVSLYSTGNRGKHQIELHVENPDPTRPVIVDGKPLLPEQTLRSRQSLETDEAAPARASFSLRGLEYGTHHGEVRLTTNDALMLDNVRYFTVEVLSPWRVLVSAPPDVMPDLVDALSPTSYETQFVPLDKLGETDLEEFAAVAVLDPTPLPPDVWRAMSEFVSNGGGLALFLGRNAQPVASFNQGEAQRVLPGKLQRQYRAGSQSITLRLGSGQHPVTNTLRSRGEAVPWLNYPVFRHWVFADLHKDASTIMTFSDNHPALIERGLGAGRILTLTTPISDPLNVAGRPEWNRLPTGPDPWPYFVLVNDLFRYLVQSGENKLNYAVGEPAVLRTSALGSRPRLQIFHPQDAWQDISSGGDTLTYRFTNTPGIYRVRNVNEITRQRGFSVNLPAAATNLDRVPTDRLDVILGPGNYRIARDRDDVNREIGEARRGRDFFPWLLALFVVVLGAESVMSNRFYSNAKTESSPRRVATL